MLCTRNSSYCLFFSFLLGCCFQAAFAKFLGQHGPEYDSTKKVDAALPRMKLILELVARCLIYSSIVALVTVVVIVLFTRDLGQILAWAALGLLGEGGLALVVGGVVSTFSSSIGKIGEVVFRSEPWDAKRARAAEGTGRMWIVAGLFLFLFGLLVSAF